MAPAEGNSKSEEDAMLFYKLSLESGQRAWGLRAARRWIQSQGFLELSSDEHTASVPSILVAGANVELSLHVITKVTLFASAGREAMYRARDWRDERTGSRFTVVFVPRGFKQSAREALGLFDFCVEYDHMG